MEEHRKRGWLSSKINKQMENKLENFEVYLCFTVNNFYVRGIYCPKPTEYVPELYVFRKL
jgi:hypothetical protein